MKRFLPILPLAFFITACTSTPAENDTKTLQSAQQNALPADTAGLAAFQAWKSQNELAAAAPVEQVQQTEAPVKTITVVREVRVQEPAPVRRTVKQRQPQPAPPVAQQPDPVQQPEASPSAGNGDVASNTGSGSEGEASQPQQETAKKGGMSNATKGAVIGGAGGAVIGAVINKKNRAAGAVIGGVLGGAVGYGLGKRKDNK